MSFGRWAACRALQPNVRLGHLTVAGRSYATGGKPRRRLRNFILGAGVGAILGVDLVVLMSARPDLKHKIDGYIPGYAAFFDQVEDYCHPALRWIKKTMRLDQPEGYRVEKVTPPVSSDAPPVAQPAKQRPRKIPDDESSVTSVESPVIMPDTHSSKTSSDKISVEKSETKKPEVLDDKESTKQLSSEPQVTVASSDKDKFITIAESKEEEAGLVPKAPAVQSTVTDDRAAKEVPVAADVAEEHLKSTFTEALDAYCAASDVVIATHVELASAMEEVRNAALVELFSSEVDEEKMQEQLSSFEQQTASLQGQAEKSYEGYCTTHQKLVGLMEDASNAGLADLVTMGNDQVFQISSAVQKVEDSVRKNKFNAEAFSKLRDALQKLDESEGNCEFSSLDEFAAAEGDSSLIALLVAKKKVDVLSRKLGEKVEEHKKLLLSTDNHKDEIAKMYEEKMAHAMDEYKTDLQLKTDSQIADARRKFDYEMLEQLRRQALNHAQHLDEALKEQADDMNGRWKELLRRKLSTMEEHYQGDLAAAFATLKGIESTIDVVATAGQNVRLQQSLHTASDSLLQALLAANKCLDPERLHSFKKEVENIRSVAGHDEMIRHLLLAVPNQAIGKGIQSEEVLKTRFERVKKICSRVSLVPLQGAGLGTYAISYLRSLLTLTVSSVPTDSDVSKLDTFQLLQLASNHLAAGNLEMTVRVMNQLKGEAGLVARDWIRDARLYLETKQAITMLADYTSAAGISLLK